MTRILVCAAGFAALTLASCGERNAAAAPPPDATAPVEAAPRAPGPAPADAPAAQAASDEGRDASATTGAARTAPAGSTRATSRYTRPTSAAVKPRRTTAARSGGSTARPYSGSAPYDEADTLPPVEVRRRTRPMTVQEELDMNRALLSPGGASSGATAPPQPR